MGALYGAGPGLPYAARLERLCAAGVALWDVCAAAERPGSLDASIRAASVVPNDIGAFLERHQHIELICCNGGGAARLFARHVVPGLRFRAASLRRVTLPSTSPAHAAMPPAAKLAAWRAALAQVAG
jgi:hypoxanthine-DNA glycosylase